ncbi:MAG: hypothetical protein QJR03_12105 [Sphaerobacter sp.]|nr:hypothetical protein [Sphaerobacter sp.]
MSDEHPPTNPREPQHPDPAGDDLARPDSPARDERQAIIGTDPFLDEYLRAPYDPINAARMEGRLLGELIRRPPKQRWMRLIAGLLGVALTAAGALGVVAAVGGGPVDPTALVMAAVFAIAGLSILWRLRGPAGSR